MKSDSRKALHYPKYAHLLNINWLSSNLTRLSRRITTIAVAKQHKFNVIQHKKKL